jgi:hypothetical protein
VEAVEVLKLNKREAPDSGSCWGLSLCSLRSLLRCLVVACLQLVTGGYTVSNKDLKVY